MQNGSPAHFYKAGKHAALGFRNFRSFRARIFAGREARLPQCWTKRRKKSAGALRADA